MSNSNTRLWEAVERLGKNRRIKTKDILYLYSPPEGGTWREGIPNLWSYHETEILNEIQRVITRGRGKITITLTSRETLRLDEAIRLVAYISLGYSAVPYEFLDLSKEK